MSTRQILSIAALIAILLIVGFLYYLSGSFFYTPATPMSQAGVEVQEQIEAEIVEEENFPMFYGETFEREFQRIEDGYRVTAKIGDSVDSIIFWYYDEMEEEGWQITQDPDIENVSFQELKAESPDGLKAHITAEDQNGSTLLTIVITSNLNE